MLIDRHSLTLLQNDALFFNNSILFLYNIWFSLLKSNNIAAKTDSYVVGFPFLLLLKHWHVKWNTYYSLVYLRARCCTDRQAQWTKQNIVNCPKKSKVHCRKTYYRIIFSSKRNKKKYNASRKKKKRDHVEWDLENITFWDLNWTGTLGGKNFQWLNDPVHSLLIEFSVFPVNNHNLIHTSCNKSMKMVQSFEYLSLNYLYEKRK